MKKINRQILKFFSNKNVSFILVPFLLIIFWVICSLLFNKQISFSVLEYGHEKNSISQKPIGKLLKGETITGQFTAKNNYLGIVLLRFNRYIKPDYRGEDVLSFRLKEKGAKDWYYYNNYRSGLVENQLLFPIGFPVIFDSKNKVYVFEIKSLFGNNTNALELSNSNPILLTGYQLPKSEIFGSKLRIIKFLFEKTINSFTNLDFIFNSTIFLLPLILYILWQLILKKLGFVKQFFSFLTILLIILDIFLLKEVYVGILLGLIIFWIISVKLYKLESSVSFFMSLILIVIWLIIIFWHLGSWFENKINIWTYFFFVLGVVQAIIEEKNKSKSLTDYKKFYGSFFKFK